MSEQEALVVRILTARKKGATAFRADRERIMSALEQGRDPKQLFTESRSSEWAFGPETLSLVSDMLAIVGATVAVVKWVRDRAAKDREMDNLRTWWKSELISRGIKAEEADQIVNQFTDDLVETAGLRVR